VVVTDMFSYMAFLEFFSGMLLWCCWTCCRLAAVLNDLGPWWCRAKLGCDEGEGGLNDPGFFLFFWLSCEEEFHVCVWVGRSGSILQYRACLLAIWVPRATSIGEKPTWKKGSPEDL
jgi:hypothetical protein